MSELLHTGICDLLGCRHPVVLAGMGGVARAELVRAVSDGGGFGFLGMVREPVALIEAEVSSLRNAGCEQFGVNLIPAATPKALLDEQIAACIDLEVPAITLFWDVDFEVVDRLRANNIKVIYQVGSLSDAQLAQKAGAQALIAQGVEAGGHVWGTRRLYRLLGEITAETDIPVIAAGGLSHGADLIVVLALGAQGICMGTALLATHEAYAHRYHKQRIIAASSQDTVLTKRFHINWPPGASVRVLKDCVVAAGKGVNDTSIQTIVATDDGRPILLWSTDSPLRSTSGRLDKMPIYCGNGVDKINIITGAADRIEQIMQEAEELCGGISGLPYIPEVSSSVCYAGEFSGTYMGQMELDELMSMLDDAYNHLNNAFHANEQRNSDRLPPFHEGSGAIAGWLLKIRSIRKALDPKGGDPNFSRDRVSQTPFEMRSELERAAAIIRPALARICDTTIQSDMRQLVSFVEARLSQL